MGRVLTERVSLAFAVEATPGVLPGTPTWKLREPNNIGAFGATIRTVARDPISPSRQRRKGTVVDLDSGLEPEADLTWESFNDFARGFFFAQIKHPRGQRPLISGALFDNLAADNDPPPAGTDAGYTHNALSGAIPANTLLWASGFSIAGNNGLKLVIAGSTTTATLISTALVDEVPGNTQNAQIEIAGVRAATSDLAITVTGTTATLTSTVLNFTTLGLNVGQLIHVGGLLLANQFSAGKGFARVRTIAANSLSLDRLDSTLATDPGTGDTVDILYGPFVRNVASTHADYVEETYQFELALPNLQVPGPGDEYEYAKGNYANTLALNVPLTDKATATWNFVGLDTELPTVTRKTNAATPRNPVRTTAFNTSADVARLRLLKVDETGITSCFKNMSLTINNQVSPEKCIGTLGAVFVNFGTFLIDVEAEVLLTDSRVVAAIRNNETLQLDFLLRNDSGAIYFDIPSLTIGGGEKQLTRQESVALSFTGAAFGDASLGYSLGVSQFPVVPLT